MELQAVLVLCGAGVAVIALLLLAGLFSTTGTTYEEAIAQQRRATTELLALASNKKPKKTKKANKKLAKKERKESASTATVSDQESEVQGESGVEEDVVPPPRPHVDFSPPVVVDVPRDTPPNIKIRKRGKDTKVKPILVNKEDPSCISDPSTPPSPISSTVSNHFEEIHPKDEFELLQSALAADKTSEKKEEVVEKRDVKSKTAVKAAKIVKPAPVVEAPKEEAVREKTNSVEAPKEQRKVKKSDKKPHIEEVVEVQQEEIVPPLNIPQPSELTTEKLLKQAGTPVPSIQPSPSAGGNKAKKNKKPDANMQALMAGDGGGVNVGELVRLMTEAALSHNEIQILTDTLLNKHHEQLPQHSEWSESPNDPMQKMKKQLAEKEKALADEVEASQALHAKLKELRANLNAERSRASAISRAVEEGAATQRAELHTLQTRLQRLLDDNHALAQEKMHLQTKLNAEAEGQAQRVQMEMHIQRLQESEATLLQQLSGIQAEVSARAVDAGQARCDATAARESMLMAQQHAAELAQQLQEANRVCAEIDSQRQSAIHSEQISQQELRKTQDRLNSELQRLTARSQQNDIAIKKSKDEVDEQKKQMSSLREQVAASEAELAELRQLKIAPAQNGLPSHTDIDHKAAEMAKVEGVIESLRTELAAAQSTSQEHRNQVTRLQEQIKQYQDKNNELRTKNWKVMEALQSTEKILQNKITALPAQDTLSAALVKAQEAQYSEVAAVLREALPSAAPSTTPDRAWLNTFADNLKKELAKAARAPAPALAQDNRLEDLKAQNKQLQDAVDKYKRIIDDTEGVLSRLQLNISAEEQKWAHKLAGMQQQIDDMQQRDAQSQKKVLLLEAELKHAKQNNGNHNFTDSERHTEENSRLMAGLTDKPKLDSYNGPLQRGLEQI